MKKLLVLIMAAVMMVSVAACGAKPALKATDKNVQSEEKSEAVESNSEEATEESAESAEEIVEEQVEESSAVSEPVSTAIPLKAGETVSVADVCEFFVDYTNITKDVMPPAPGSFYSHYEAEDGKVYVDLCVSYKNLETSDADADEIMKGILIYGGQYEYTGFSMIEEESRSDFTYSNITSIAPLSTEYLHYLFEVPEEVENSGWDIKIVFMIEGTEYEVVVREGTTGETTAQSESAEQKTSGELKVGEVVAIANVCEFNVDYSAISAKVMPPVPGDFYSYYEAEDGKVYVDFCIAYKNLQSSDKAADEVMGAKLTYAGKYEYAGFSMIEEDGRGDFTYSNITSIAPLNTEYVHYLFEVPAEVETSTDPIAITFMINGNTYTYTVR